MSPAWGNITAGETGRLIWIKGARPGAAHQRACTQFDWEGIEASLAREQVLRETVAVKHVAERSRITFAANRGARGNPPGVRRS